MFEENAHWENKTKNGLRFKFGNLCAWGAPSHGEQYIKNSPWLAAQGAPAAAPEGV